ncbi:MAG: NADH-quinone oxidoreductase subunit [Friedmanniella sp.]|nr:NADH-quinone oxidoreductase subunit [Friedmanniella sp.]
MRVVPAEGWDGAAAEAYAEGWTAFDWLGAVDEIGRRDCLRIVLALRDPTRPGEPELLLSTDLPRSEPRVASLRERWAGAGWHEREAAELFGVEFVGGERRALLLGADFAGTPLRKDEVLAARTGAPWPGGKEPGESAASPSRRRMMPPGVPDPEVWGDRDAAAPDADADEIAASAVGGRVRRRPR